MEKLTWSCLILRKGKSGTGKKYSLLTHIFEVNSNVRPLVGICVNTVTLPEAFINRRTTLARQRKKKGRNTLTIRIYSFAKEYVIFGTYFASKDAIQRSRALTPFLRSVEGKPQHGRVFFQQFDSFPLLFFWGGGEGGEDTHLDSWLERRTL